ncbi:MAG TPA: hypothetical protein VN737_01355 [Bryobacteraceae bacterium]|nr:hypothetical protein [Bryobacteraceae bacterium]
MEIDVRAHNIVWTADLQERVERSIEFAVDRHKSRIPRISLHVRDVNGPRGGADKLCQITADVRGAQPVMIVETGVDVLAVINRAVRRLAYRIGRRLHRERIAGAPEHRETIRAA